MARGVETVQEAIATASVGVFARLESARALGRASHQARVREDDHRRATTAASEAFQKRDYQRVIELLEPFADVLTRAERAKLAYARRHG